MNRSHCVATSLLNVGGLAFCFLASQAAIAAGTAAVPAGVPISQSRDQGFAVRVDNGSRILLRVCRPATDLPARLVVINHGSGRWVGRELWRLRSCRLLSRGAGDSA
jgi:hypothetical protein